MDNSEKDSLLETMMITYGDQLTRLAYSYVRDKEIAKDLVQDVFIKSYINWEKFRHESSVKTWLYRITINTAKDYLKSWSYRKLKVSELYQFNIKSNASSEDEALHNWEKNNVKHTVFDLPTKYREVIFLYYYEEFTIKEISELMNIPMSTVKTRLGRGKSKLKEKLERAEIVG
ncbi:MULTISPECIES: sigma-70 family RNA polymerase sigma factor [Sutcliffiella]|uniref:sigma-70 family RNA polymerase sigma factor n=1 Tax=Sutcliffiella TaxID=2837511 RepID=UPI0022DCF35C|nr:MULTISPECIES: sigma-70 family RNA polymerase sigma factor [Sutcliffiella]MED4017890.1 sigma-70 family RNA polymerase sigma factor [Sutcliffiella cohnii]WBL16606.1 sigma-70 family RNA polymerase sigma factor [Sutcliffiella sp. NC1]